MVPRMCWLVSTASGVVYRWVWEWDERALSMGQKRGEAIRWGWALGQGM